MAKVELIDLEKRYGNSTLAIDGITLKIEDGEILSLLGPSGSGKTTLLRLISGLERPDRGRILIDGSDVTRWPPHARNLAMLFQTPALYPYLSIFENLAFSVRTQGLGRSEVDRRVNSTAQRLGLLDLMNRYPDSLSGGQKQRAALGRAFARRPAITLLDEPFSSLDAPLRSILRNDLSEFQSQDATTMLLVTHDQADALRLSNRIALMNRGKIVQIGTPRELYEQPLNRFAAHFLGDPPMNQISCKVLASDPLSLLPEGLEASQPITFETLPGFDFSSQNAIVLGLRPEAIHLDKSREPFSSRLRELPGPLKILRLEYQGGSTFATLSFGSSSLCVALDPEYRDLEPGDLCRVAFSPTRAHFFDRDGLALPRLGSQT